MSIVEGEIEERPEYQVVDSGNDSAPPWILDRRVWVSFGAGNHIGAAIPHHLEEANQLSWREIEVGVEEHDVVAPRMSESGL